MTSIFLTDFGRRSRVPLAYSREQALDRRPRPILGLVAPVKAKTSIAVDVPGQLQREVGEDDAWAREREVVGDHDVVRLRDLPAPFGRDRNRPAPPPVVSQATKRPALGVRPTDTKLIPKLRSW